MPPCGGKSRPTPRRAALQCRSSPRLPSGRSGHLLSSMARLKRADCSEPGIRRRRRGKGFEYLDGDDRRVTEPSVLTRIQELAIPPAWEDVWICPSPMG